MLRNAGSEKLGVARMAVFHAALRTKQFLRGQANEHAVASTVLFRELEGLGLDVQRRAGGAGVVNRLVLVRVAQIHPPGKPETEALADELREQELPLGVLVDFERDLILDGLATVTVNQAVAMNMNE